MKKILKALVAITFLALVSCLSFVLGARWMMIKQANDQLTLSLETAQLLRSGETQASIQRTEAISSGMIIRLFRYQSLSQLPQLASLMAQSYFESSKILDGKSTAAHYFASYQDANFSDDAKSCLTE